MPRPVLGKLSVGHRLLLIQASHKRWGDEIAPIETEVVKLGRVWVELAELDTSARPRTWRLRMDTQRTDNGTNYNDRFVTAEQYAWEQRISAARDAVAGLKLDWSSPWLKDEDRLLALAAFVTAYDAEHPTVPAA
jgi:hypothetical protein